MEYLNIATLVGLVVVIVLASLTLYKLDKKSNENFLVKDIGPPGSSGYANLPADSQFPQNCKDLFNSFDSEDTYTVCGNDTQVGKQDYTNMDDMSCSGAPYQAYSKEDCDKPLSGTNGYLCGGQNCPAQNISGSLGSAPKNPWGCTDICQ